MMPTYCYRMDSTGKIREAVISVAEMEKGRGKFTFEDGKAGVRDHKAEFAPGKQIKAAWPIHSRALAVHPRQIKKAKEYARERGVNVDFDGKGQPILETPAHRRDYMSIRKVHDLDSFY